MRVVLLATLALIVFAVPAQADPIIALIGAVSGAIKGSAILAGLAKIAFGQVLTVLAQKIQGRKARDPGQDVPVRTTGEDQSETIVLGRAAVAGNTVYMNSHGQDGDTPNAFLQHVIEVSGAPGVRLRAVIAGRYLTVADPLTQAPVSQQDDTEGTPEWAGLMAPGFAGSVTGTDQDYGYAVSNPQFRDGDKDCLWLRWYDGTQTAADPQLVASYGTDPDRPWTSAMVGAKLAYVIATFRRNAEVFQSGMPELRFIVDGIPLYDPRADSSVGGDGPQRWDDPTTWVRSTNNMVIAYNVGRGITLPSGDRFGGAYAAPHQLPLDEWMAAMNACDEQVAKPGGGTGPRYQFGEEVRVADTQPHDVMDRCAATCQAQYAERGDVLHVRVGGPDVPVATITDGDISVSDPATLKPKKSLAQRNNAIATTYLEPRNFWQPATLPMLTNADWEAEDGGRRLPVENRLSGCFVRSQADDLQQADILDDRRQRIHNFVAPPEYGRLKCTDTLAWTSDENGYDAEVFEVVDIEERPDTLFVALTLRGRNAGDYLPRPAQALVPMVPGPDPTPAQTVSGFAVAAVTITNAGGQSRPGIEMTWTAAALSDVQLLEWQARIGADVVATGTAAVAEGSALVTGAELAATAYTVRARPIADRATLWTDWLSVTTNDVRLSAADLSGALSLEIQQGAQAALVADPRFYNVVVGSPNTSPGWTADALAFFAADEALNGTYSLSVFAATGTTIAAENNVLFEVLPGYRYFVACSIWRGGIAEFDTLQVGLRWYDADGDPLSDSWVSSGDETTFAAFVWVPLQGQLTAPSGAAFARLAARYVNKTTTGIVRWDGFDCRRADGEALIQPGGITAPMINVESLSAVSANIGLLRSAASGERVEIEDDKISVFDSSGQIRVRIGNLS